MRDSSGFQCIDGGESLSLAREPFQQWSGCPVVAMLPLKFDHLVVDLLEPDRVGVPHGPAAIGGKAVAGDVDCVDVGGTLSDAFGENARTFIDHDVGTSF